MIVKNLGVKELKAGDVIVGTELVDAKFGQIYRFTVNRVDKDLERAVEDVMTKLREALY